jgi:hypothetical protein
LLTLDVISGFLASDNIVRLARIFNALSSCQKDIALYYDEVGQKTAPPLSSLFPKPTPMDPSVVLPILTYKQFLTRAGQPTSILVGLGDNKVPPYILLPWMAPTTMLLSSLLRVITKRHIVLSLALDSLPSYTSVSALSVACT